MSVGVWEGGWTDGWAGDFIRLPSGWLVGWLAHGLLASLFVSVFQMPSGFSLRHGIWGLCDMEGDRI